MLIGRGWYSRTRQTQSLRFSIINPFKVIHGAFNSHETLWDIFRTTSLGAESWNQYRIFFFSHRFFSFFFSDYIKREVWLVQHLDPLQYYTQIAAQSWIIKRWVLCHTECLVKRRHGIWSMLKESETHWSESISNVEMWPRVRDLWITASHKEILQSSTESDWRLIYIVFGLKLNTKIYNGKWMELFTSRFIRYSGSYCIYTVYLASFGIRTFRHKIVSRKTTVTGR